MAPAFALSTVFQ